MAKALRTVGKIAGVVAAVAGVVAGVATGNPALVATALKVGAIAGATSAVASTGAALLAKPPAVRGSITQTTIGADQPTPYMVGYTYSGGAMVHRTAYGPTQNDIPNPYRAIVNVYSAGGPIGGIDRFLLDFEPLTIGAGGNVAGYYNNLLYVTASAGAIGAAALAGPWAQAIPGWGASAKLSGKAHALWSAKWDRGGKWSAGMGQLGIEGRGVLTWDPRKDSTWPGGSGPQRWASPASTAAFDAARATWTYTNRPGLHALRYALGTWERDPAVSGSVYRCTFGLGMPLDQIVVEDFVRLENVCEANGWTVSGVLFEPGDKADNLKRILAAGAAQICWKGGRLGLKITTPGVSLDTITRDDLADGTLRVPGMLPWRERINTVIPQYRSPAHKWEMQSSAKITLPDQVAADGEEKLKAEPFEMVTDVAQAAQLAALALLDRQEAAGIEISVKARLRRYRGGDRLTLHPSLVAEAGLEHGEVVVIDRSFDPTTMAGTMTFVTDTAAKHPLALGQTGAAPAAITLPTPAQIADAAGAANGRPLTPRGPWDPGASYSAGDLVQYQGSTWLFTAATAVTGAVPPTLPQTSNSWWQIFASAGADASFTLDPNQLTVAEKPLRVATNGEYDQRWTVADARAAQITATAVTGARTDAANARTAWINYSSGLDQGGAYPEWNDLTGPTPIVRADFENHWGTRRSTLVSLEAAIRAYDSGRLAELEELADDVADDDTLTVEEKHRLILFYRAAYEEQGTLNQQSIARGVPFGGVASAYQTLGQVLGSLGVPGAPAWNDTGGDTQLDTGERQALHDAIIGYGNAKLAFQVAVDAAAREAEADALSTSEQALLAAQDAVADGVFAPAEKTQAHVHFDALSARLAAIEARFFQEGAPGDAADERTTANTKVGELEALLDSLGWDDTTTPTDITDRQGYIEAWAEAQTAVEEFRFAVDGRTAERVARMSSNGWFEKGEKWPLVIQYQALAGRELRLRQRYTALGYPPSVTAAQQAAFAALGPDPATAGQNSLGYKLGQLTPSWVDSNVDTPIPDPVGLQSTWIAAENAIDAFAAAMLANPLADRTLDQPVVARLDPTTGQLTSRRGTSMFSIGGAQQVILLMDDPNRPNGYAGNPLRSTYNGNGTARVEIVAHRIKDDAGYIDFPAGSIENVQPDNDVWIYDDANPSYDPWLYQSGNFNAGWRNYQITQEPTVLGGFPNPNPYRRLVGAIHTASPGAPAQSGSSGGGAGVRYPPSRYNQLEQEP